MSQISTSVGSAVNGSRNAVAGSGSSTMSDCWMPRQPEIDEPSNILPSSNSEASTIDAGNVGETQVDEFDGVVADQLFDVLEGHGGSKGGQGHGAELR